jgi:hypothetical protein
VRIQNGGSKPPLLATQNERREVLQLDAEGFRDSILILWNSNISAIFDPERHGNSSAPSRDIDI